MAAAVVGAGAVCAAGAKMEALSFAAGSSIACGSNQGLFFVGNAGRKKNKQLVALRSNALAGVETSGKRSLSSLVRALGGNSTTTTAEVPTTSSSSSDEAEVPIEKRFPAFPAALDINQIMNILPHRFPFLLVDRVIEYNQGQSAVAIKNVTINDNFFPGHFPQRPIMPGVLKVEAMAQVGGIVMLQPDGVRLCQTRNLTEAVWW